MRKYKNLFSHGLLYLNKTMTPEPLESSLQAEKDIYDTDTVFLFTWAPNPSKYPSSKPTQQYKLLLCWTLLSAYKCFSTFAFTPELTLNGNIHVHGWFVIKDKIKYYKWFIPRCRQLGFVKVDICKDKKTALEYYKKDMIMMSDILTDKYPVPITHLNHQDYRSMYINIKPKVKSYAKRLPSHIPIDHYINK